MKKIEFKGVKFLLIVFYTYLVLLIFDFDNSLKGFQNFIDIIIKLLPIFLFIILLTTLINYFLQPRKMMKYFGKDSEKRGIFYMLLGGTLSHGPMYAWYGMLEDMRKHGLKDGLIVIFLYARAIKLPLLPFMVSIFGITFTIVINLYILIFAIVQGKIMDKLK
jgi:uncharacterized membrane protein YraQ (UPF0718 family)